MSLDGFIAGPNDGPENPWAMTLSGAIKGYIKKVPF